MPTKAKTYGSFQYRSSMEAYSAYCPTCKKEVIEHKPWKARFTMAFTCGNCGCRFIVDLESLRAREGVL